MIIYEVNLSVDAAIFAPWHAWLVAHVGEMLALPGFESAQVFETVEPAPQQGRRNVCVQYRLIDAAALQRYLRDDAARMRAQGEQRFAGHFSATRRVLVPA